MFFQDLLEGFSALAVLLINHGSTVFSKQSVKDEKIDLK
jgi:hypothetical protein